MRLTITITAALLALAGCGDSEAAKEPTVQASDVLDYPACDDVWVAGQILPADYEGCEGRNGVELGGAFNCPDGTQLVSYDPKMWAVTGQAIHEHSPDVASDPLYGEAYTACNAR